MSLAALLLYLVGLFLALGVRMLVAWRRTGDTGLRRPAGTGSGPAWWGGVLFVAALLLGLAAPVAALVGLPPAPLEAPPAVSSAGIAAMGIGLLLVLVSQAAMGASWRIGVDTTERTDLVTTGIFAAVRNPIFTAMGVLLVGMVVAVPTVVSAAAFVVFVAAVQVQVRAVEEPYLARTHGTTYLDYACRTGRFLPGLGRLTNDPSTAGGPR